jgi:hypothetical protein
MIETLRKSNLSAIFHMMANIMIIPQWYSFLNMFYMHSRNIYKITFQSQLQLNHHLSFLLHSDILIGHQMEIRTYRHMTDERGLMWGGSLKGWIAFA